MAKRTRIGRRLLLSITIVVCVILGLSAALVLAERRLDKVFASRYEEQLNTLSGFEATVGGATVYSTERRFVFNDIVIRKTGVGDRPPYFRVDTMEVQLDGPWYDTDSRLDVTLTGPKFYLVRGGANPQLEPDPQWREKVSAQLPYEADALTIRQGEVTFVDKERGARWHARFSGSAKHLIEGADPNSEQRVVAGLTASLEGGGLIQGSIETKTGMDTPPFLLRLSVKDFPLERVQGLLQRRFDLGVERGRLAINLQASGESGRFKGRFRPSFSAVDLESKGGRDTLKSTVGEWVTRKLERPVGDHSAWISIRGTYGPEGMSLAPGSDLSFLQTQLVDGLSRRLEK